MDNSGPSENIPDSLSLAELRQQLREARIDRDGWRIQARLSNNHLQRIFRSPAWKLTKPFRIINLVAWKFKPELHDYFSDPWTIVKSGATVWQAIGDRVTIEASAADLEASRIAVLAHWSNNPTVSKSVNALIDELLLNSYEVVLVSACESQEELKFDNNQQEKITVLRKPNYGYDFGSWSVAVSYFPQIMSADEVLILNDSNVGPFGPIEDILCKMSESPYDITGITDSLQIRYHIQSYMMHFKNGALLNEAVSKFWREIYSQDDKMGVIQAYELGLTSRAQSNGLRVGAIFPWNLITDYWENPSIHGAERLIELGFPFLKREILKTCDAGEKLKLANCASLKFTKSEIEIQRFFST
jgi:hypothetical protein